MTETDPGVNSAWWDYRQDRVPKSFGDYQTYQRGLEWLDGCGPVVEDWGCGLTFGKRYITKSAYRGIDGSANNPFSDELADLRKYTSEADGIFMRHVLEHNADWPLILGNAVKSFKRRFVLVLFTPLREATGPNNPGHFTLDISFRKEDLTAFFEGLTWTEEFMKTDTQYGWETLFLVERPDPTVAGQGATTSGEADTVILPAGDK